MKNQTELNSMTEEELTAELRTALQEPDVKLEYIQTLNQELERRFPDSETNKAWQKFKAEH